MATKPFWEIKSLREMNAQEWESLCDGCGLCCLVRFEEQNTGEIVPTRVACRLFDAEQCRCGDYHNRERRVPECVKLTPGNVANLNWMPPSCAYRRLDQGKSLPRWHPLITKDPNSVHIAGVSVRGQTINEAALEDPDDALDFTAREWLADRSDG
ncbi:MAG TPA: YcgN family cysteine cluster protein [Caulobacteraceae bacterium]